MNLLSKVLFIICLMTLSAPVLNAATWDGGSVAVDGTEDDWATAENWVGDVVPAANDSIIFDISGGSVVVDLAAADTLEINSFTVTGGANSLTIDSSGGALQWNNSGNAIFAVASGCTVEVNGGLKQTGNELRLTDSGVINYDHSDVGLTSAIKVNAGTFAIKSSGDTGSGTITVAAGAVLHGAGTAADVVIQNFAALQINKSETFTIDSLVLSAASGLDIFIDDDVGGDASDNEHGVCTISGNLTLDGTVLVQSGDFGDDSYTFITAGGTITNNTASVAMPTADDAVVEVSGSNVVLVVGNRTPTTGANTVTLDEDTDFVFGASTFNYADADGDAFAGISITANPSAGNLYNDINGDGIRDGGEDVNTGTGLLSATVINSGRLKFKPVSNANGAGYGDFSFTVNDGTASSSAAVMTVDVNAINDLPTAASNSSTIAQDNDEFFIAADFNFSDVEDANLTQIQVTSIPVNGVLYIDGDFNDTIGGSEDVSNNDFVTLAEIANLQFKPGAAENGTPYDSFEFKVQDANSGLSVAAYTYTINVTAGANSAPGLTGSTLVTLEDTDLSLNSGMIAYTDADNDALVTIRVNPIPGTGVLYIDDNNNGVNDGASEEIAVDETITKAELDAGKLKFKPAADDNGAAYTTFGLFAHDGSAESSPVATYTMNVTAVNDAPVISTGFAFASIAQGVTNSSGDSVESMLDSESTDVDSTPSKGLAIFSIDTANGDWEFSTNNGTNWSSIGAVSTGSALHLLGNAGSQNKIRFVPSGGYTGSASIQYRAWDDTDGNSDDNKGAIGSIGGSGAHSASIMISTIEVLSNVISWDDGGGGGSANDWDNSGNWSTNSVPGDNAFILFNIAVDNAIDVDVNGNSDPTESMSRVEITGAGTMTFNGTGSTLTFVNGGNLVVPAGATLVLHCPINVDSNGTLNVSGGGTVEFRAVSPGAVGDTIIVTGSTIIRTDSAATIGTLQLQDTAILSPGGDGSDGTLTVSALTMQSTNTLKIDLDNDDAGSNDLIVVTGNVTIDGSLVINDLVADDFDDVDPYSLITYGGALTNNVFVLTMPGTDPGAVQLAAGEVQLNVGNQAPTVTGSSVPTNEDTDVGISTANLGYSDPEPDALDYITVGTISVASGGFFYLDDTPTNLSYDATEELAASNTVTAAQIASGLLRYHPALNDTANATMNFTATDVIGAVSGTATITITINAQNDLPQFDSTAVTAAVDNTLYTYTIQVSDPEDAAADIVVTTPTRPAWLTTFTDNNDGTFTLSGTPATLDIGNHNVSLVVTDLNSATATQNFTITVTDGNTKPTLPALTPYNKTVRDTALVLSYNNILTHTGATDPDLDTLTFRVISLGTGTLVTSPGLATVNVGNTISPGESWQWTPPGGVESVNETAFTLEVSDASLDSGTPRAFTIFVDTVDLPPDKIYLGSFNSGNVQVNTLSQIAFGGTDLYYFDPEDTNSPDFHFSGQPGWTDPYDGLSNAAAPTNEDSVRFTIKTHLDTNVGGLFLGGSATPLAINATFTQEDIMNGDLVYKASGSVLDGSSGDDIFTFDVDDGNGNVTTGVSLTIDVVFNILAPTVDLYSQAQSQPNPGTFFFTEDAVTSAVNPVGSNATQLFKIPNITGGASSYNGGSMTISITGGTGSASGDNISIVNGSGWKSTLDDFTVVGNQVRFNDTDSKGVGAVGLQQIATIDAVENGINGQPLTLTWAGVDAYSVDGISNVTIISSLLSLVSYQYVGDQPPTDLRSIQVAITDSNLTNEGLSSRNLRVVAVNDPPANLANVTLTVLDGAVVRAVFTLSDPDNDVEDLSLILNSGPTNTTPVTGALSINDPEPGVIEYEDFSLDSAANDTFTLLVTDGSINSTVPATITIVDRTISADPPTLASDAPMIVEESVNFFYTPVVDPRWITDNPGAVFQYSLAGQVPVGLSVVGTQIQWINPDPQSIKNASLGIIIEDTNSGKIGYQPIIITVKSAGGT